MQVVLDIRDIVILNTVSPILIVEPRVIGGFGSDADGTDKTDRIFVRNGRAFSHRFRAPPGT